MHISNFRPVKRVVDVIRVFARVRAQQPCVLVMVGDGPDRHAAEEEARRLGVSRRRVQQAEQTAHRARLGHLEADATVHRARAAEASGSQRQCRSSTLAHVV